MPKVNKTDQEYRLKVANNMLSNPSRYTKTELAHAKKNKARAEYLLKCLKGRDSAELPESVIKESYKK